MKNKISVIQVVTAPTGGGAEFLVREINRRLPNYGVNSNALFFTNPGNIVLGEREECLNLTYPQSPAAIILLRNFIKQYQRSDIHVAVHSHLTWPLIYTPLAARKLSIPLFFTEHATYNRRRAFPVAKYIDQAIYKNYYRIICISQGTRVQLVRWLNDNNTAKKIKVIMNGARLLERKSRAHFKPNKLKIVSVGSLTSIKGFDIALRAVDQARQIISKYTIVGEGPDRVRIEKIISRLNLDNIVVLAGWADDITPYLHDADVSLIPSRSEGFGLVAVEAMSTGLPIIASNIDGLREVVNGSAAFLVAPENPEEIVKAIQYVHGTLLQGKNYMQKAREQAEKYNLDKMVEMYASQYKELIN